MADSTNTLNIIINAIDNASRSLNNIKNGLMGLSFSALFMGMQLNRFITKFIDSAINAYKIAGTENEYFTVKTNELSAAWEFFKFSLIDALSQSELFRWLLEQVIALIDWFNRLDEGQKKFIAIAVAVAAVGTLIISLLGNVGLLVVSFANLLTNLSLIGGTTGIIGGLRIIFSQLWYIITACTEAIISFFMANPWILLIISIVIFIGFIAALYKKLGDVGNVLKFFGGLFIWTFAMIGDALYTLLMLPFIAFIKLLDLAIKTFNRLTGKKIPTISSMIPDMLQPGFMTRSAESYLGNAEWFKSVQDARNQNGAMSVGDVTSQYTEMASAIAKGVSQALKDNQIAVVSSSQR